MPSPNGPKLANVSNVELMFAGQWALSSGMASFNRDDLIAAVAAQSCPAVRRPVLKMGHSDPRVKATDFDGTPTIGWIQDMRTDLDGHLLLGDYRGMPAWMTEVDGEGNSVIASAFPDRSIEGCYDFRCQLGHLHPFVITAVALLGETPPGIGTLASLQDVAALYTGVAASSSLTGVPVTVTIHASKESAVPSPTPQLVSAAVSVDDLRKEFNERAPWDQWITEIQLDPLQLIVLDDGSQSLWRVPVTLGADGSITFGTAVKVEVNYVDATDTEDAPVIAAAPARFVFAARGESRPGDKPAASPLNSVNVPATPPPVAAAPAPTVPAAEPVSTEPKEAPQVSTLSEDMRSRLGLPADADEAAILAAVDALKTAAPPAPTTETAPVEPVAEAVTEPVGELVSASAAKPTTPTAAVPDPRIEAMASELSSATRQLADIRAASAAKERSTVLDSAQREGKFKPADRSAWEKRYDAAPPVITEVLAAIAPGTAVPVVLAGYPGNPEDAVDDGADDDARLFAPDTFKNETEKAGV